MISAHEMFEGYTACFRYRRSRHFENYLTALSIVYDLQVSLHIFAHLEVYPLLGTSETVITVVRQPILGSKNSGNLIRAKPNVNQ